MVQAWYIIKEDLDEDGLGKPETEAQNLINLETLQRKSGIELTKVPPGTTNNEAHLTKLKAEKGYAFEDTFEIKPTDKLVKKYATEHLHEYDEIRLILEGGAYYDVRDDQENWIRIHLKKGDMITLPAGIYHGIILDRNKYVKLRRYFDSDPKKFIVHERPADHLNSRKKYLQFLKSKL